jgi:hypothetical protein
MTQRLRPGIAEPVFLMFSRQQIGNPPIFSSSQK